MFQRVTTNLGGARTRLESLEGKQYLVVPTVMLTVGVHNGSEGPLFYSAEHLGQSAVVWNHKPIVLYHPTLNGEGITACDPTVVQSRRVGMLFNTTFDGRLRTESWLEEDKLGKIARPVLDAVREGKMLEVSTGLFHTPDGVPGVWNGEHYFSSATGIQPDHLAILPDEVGACSIADGAGLLRNSAGTPAPQELSHEETRDQLRTLVREHPNYSPASGDYPYVSDVYPKYAIVEHGGRSYKHGYKSKQGKVSLDADREEVRKVTSYLTANGEVWKGWEGRHFRLSSVHEDVTIPKGGDTVAGNNTTTNALHQGAANLVTDPPVASTPAPAQTADGQARPAPPTRKERVSQMISSYGWTENDRGMLEGMADPDFERVSSYVLRGKDTVIQPYTYDGVGDRSNVHTANQAPTANRQPMTLNEYVGQAPPELREALVESVNAHAETKRRLVASIVANKANLFTEAYLGAKSIQELRGIAALAGGQPQSAQVNNYAGQGAVPMYLANNVAPTEPQAQPPLALPSMGWERKK